MGRSRRDSMTRSKIIEMDYKNLSFVKKKKKIREVLTHTEIKLLTVGFSTIANGKYHEKPQRHDCQGPRRFLHIR